MSRFPRSGLFCLLYLLVLLKYECRVLPKSQVTLHQHALNITIVQVSGNDCTLSYHPTLWLWELHRFCSWRFPVSDRQNWVYWGLLIKRSLLMEAFSSIISNSITMRIDREEICIITYVPSLVRTSSTRNERIPRLKSMYWMHFNQAWELPLTLVSANCPH